MVGRSRSIVQRQGRILILQWRTERTCIGLLGWLSPWDAAAAKRSPNAGSVRSPRGADEATMTRAARPEERSGRRLPSAKRVARGDAMAGDAEPPDDAWRWSSTKVADRWMPCFLRYAIAATGRGRGAWSACAPVPWWSELLGDELFRGSRSAGGGAVGVPWPLFRNEPCPRFQAAGLTWGRARRELPIPRRGMATGDELGMVSVTSAVTL